MPDPSGGAGGTGQKPLAPDAGSGAGGMAEKPLAPGTGAGGMGGDIAAIASSAGCVYDGRGGPGGSDAVPCRTLTVLLSPAVERSSTIELSTDLQARVPVTNGGTCNSPVCAWVDPTAPDLGRIFLTDRFSNQSSPSPSYPTTVTVRVAKQGSPVAEKTVSNLHYRCVARTFDDWCWEAEPVTIQFP